MEPAAGGAWHWVWAMAVETGEQGCDPHRKGCKKMSRGTCDITVNQGKRWSSTELTGDSGREVHFIWRRGIKRLVVLGHLELDGQRG